VGDEEGERNDDAKGERDGNRDASASGKGRGREGKGDAREGKNVRDEWEKCSSNRGIFEKFEELCM
jgi:hypothetical protein